MARMPWFAFYPADWLSDASLASCSPYARGVWIDLLAVAYQCDPAGILATDMKPWSDDRIARSIRGGSVSENLAALNELIDAGVARRMGFDDPIPGAIYSKRMVADMQERDRNYSRVKDFRARNANETQMKRVCNADETDLKRKRNANVMGRQQSDKSREEKTTSSSVANRDDDDGTSLDGETLKARIAYLCKRPDWVPESKPWITPAGARRIALAAGSNGNPALTMLDIQAALKDAKQCRHTLDNPAGFVIKTLLEIATQKGTHASQPDHQAKSA